MNIIYNLYSVSPYYLPITSLFPPYYLPITSLLPPYYLPITSPKHKKKHLKINS